MWLVIYLLENLFYILAESFEITRDKKKLLSRNVTDK